MRFARTLCGEQHNVRECRTLGSAWGALGNRRPYHEPRIRVGDYRVVYDIDDDSRTVTVIRVKHRREAYRNL